MSGGSAENTSLYRLGTRFIEVMPTLASVTPPVPPRMIISAGMSMKEAGLVPPISELIIREPKATPIPMAVAAFIAATSAIRKQFFNPGVRPCTNGQTRPCGGSPTGRRAPAALASLARLVLDGREPRRLARDGHDRGLALGRAAAPQCLAQHRRSVGLDGRGDLGGRLGDDDLGAGGERDDGVGRGLDRHDHVGVQMERLVAVSEP